MNAQIEKLKSDLANNLLALDSTEDSLEKLYETLKIIDETIENLNKIIEQTPSESEKDEIEVFKYVKPDIISRRIEEVLRYNLKGNTPIGTEENKIKYFEDELKARRSFFRMNKFHYEYFKNGMSHLDHLYFLRGNGQPIVPVVEFAESENELSTPMTYLFAKFIAYEHLQYYILEQIAMIKYPDSHQTILNGLSGELKWTGDSVNIVELAYGIWLTGQMNNGNASLNQIVRWLESTLSISIGIIQRRFNEIERRKRLSPTKFIDQMKDAIMQKINSGNS